MQIKRSLAFIFFTFITLLTGYVCFYNLGKAPLENWDEAWYGDMTRNMLQTGNLITLVWNKVVLFDKPPLLIWINTIIASLFGLHELTLRLTSATSGFLTILLVTKYSFKKWGFIPAMLAFATISMNNIFIWRVRSGNIDALATFLIFLTFFFIQMKNKYKYYGLGLLFGLIYLTKASLVGFPLFIFILHELFYERRDIRKKWKGYVSLFSIIIVICGSWLFFGFLKEGIAFPQYYILHSDQGVAKISLSSFKIDYLLFAYYSLQRRFAYLFIGGLALLAVSIKKKEFFLIFCFSTFLLFLLSFTERNNNWYLMPSMPFWSLVIGFGVFKMQEIASKRHFFYLLFSFFLLLASFYVSSKTYRENIIPLMNSTGTKYQKQSGEVLSRISKLNEIIVRTDGMYPTTIFYAERKVLSYQKEMNAPHATFIGKDLLIEGLKDKTYRWLVGPKNETTNLILELGPHYAWHMEYENSEEVIMRLK